MKFAYKLKSIDKKIMKILNILNTVKLKVLNKMIHDFDLFGDMSEKELIQYLYKIHSTQNSLLDFSSKLSLELPRRTFEKSVLKDINNRIVVLKEFDLVEQKNVFEFSGTIGGDEYGQIEVKLTRYGKEIAEKIKQGRKVTLRPPSLIKKQAFIACALGYPELDELCEKVFCPIVKDLKLKYFRVDKSEPEQTITDSIIENIARSTIIVSDLTYARPSVYFETGLALGMGIPVLLTCRHDHLKKANDTLRVHFDLEQFKISFWKLKTDEFHWSKGMHPKIRIKNLC